MYKIVIMTKFYYLISLIKIHCSTSLKWYFYYSVQLIYFPNESDPAINLHLFIYFDKRENTFFYIKKDLSSIQVQFINRIWTKKYSNLSGTNSKSIEENMIWSKSNKESKNFNDILM